MKLAILSCGIRRRVLCYKADVSDWVLLHLRGDCMISDCSGVCGIKLS